MNRQVVCRVVLCLSTVGPVATGQPSDPRPSALSRVKNRAVHAALHRTFLLAARKLANEGCANVLLEFRDRSGRSLSDLLMAMRETAPLYLSLIVFADGDGRAGCAHPRTFAVTSPGSRVVYLCPQFALMPGYSDGDRANALIHEAMHSLGLGENPPSPQEITMAIEERCGR